MLKIKKNTPTKEPKDISDLLGMGLSFLCLFHCLVGPFLILSMPFVFTAYFYSPWFHFVLALFVLPIGGYSFFRGYQVHKNIWVVIFGTIGLLMILAVGFLPPYGGRNLTKETYIIFASLVLIVAHLMNYRLRSKN